MSLIVFFLFFTFIYYFFTKKLIFNYGLIRQQSTAKQLKNLQEIFGSIKDIPDDAFEKIMNNNIKSNHNLCQMVIPEMMERKDGSIIIVSSIGGLNASPVIGAYNISKAADIMLVKNYALEFGQHNIRTNAIAPGLFRTDFAKALWENPEILKQSTATCPMKRIGEPDEIGGAAVFLASEAGSFVNGHTLVIDGGTVV